MKARTFLPILILVAGAGLAPVAAQEASTPAPAPAAGETEGDKSLLGVIRKGGWAVVPLFGLSVFTVTFIAYSFLTIRRGTVVTRKYLASVDAYLKSKDYLGLVALSSHEGQSLARVVHATLEFATRNPGVRFAVLREIAETEGSRQAADMFQRVSYLFDVGVIAPMLGLAGTVTGMITSFHVIGIDPEGMRPAMLANGVAEALIATAGGLVVGIPAMIFYSILKGRASALVSELEAQTTNFLAYLELQHDPRADRPPPPPPPGSHKA
ncbi:MAG: MotA/TolQ/ExbB proton channel family protein [Verrucomicrobiae bacterium]|nr:MotA/TolQ/ExbB proton channel family protein [Verrucomicrobiae bacterium]